MIETNDGMAAHGVNTLERTSRGMRLARLQVPDRLLHRKTVRDGLGRPLPSSVLSKSGDNDLLFYCIEFINKNGTFSPW